MTAKLRTFVVALLTMALLAAPCLSVIDMFKAGAAHAHHASHGQQNSSREAAAGHHTSQALRQHEQTDQNIVAASYQMGDPSGEQAFCCRMCDGWLTKNGRDVVIATAPVQPELLLAISRPNSAYPVGDLTTRAPPSGILAPTPARLALQSAGKEAPYAATRRLRI